MAKFVNISDVKAVGFTAIKFAATEDRKESTALEMSMYDGAGNFLRAATMPLQVKAPVAAVGMGEVKVTEGTTRRAFGPNGELFTVKGLAIVEGDRNPQALRVHGDFEVEGVSAIKRLVRKDLVEVDPFA